MEGSPFAEKVVTAEPSKASLYYSVRTVLPTALLALGALAVFCYSTGWPFWPVLLLLPFLAVTPRRVDLDETGLTVLAMVPYLPGQRFEFRSLGPFQESRSCMRSPDDRCSSLRGAAQLSGWALGANRRWFGGEGLGESATR